MENNAVIDALEALAPAPQEPILKARFTCDLQFCRYTFKGGKDAIFMNGEYLTDVESEVKELMAEIESGHVMIHIDKEKPLVDVRARDPVEAIREQVRLQLIQEAKDIAESNRDMGTSEPGALNVANTKSVGEAMSGSTSIDGVAAQAAAGASTVVAAAPVGGSTVAAARTITPGPISK